MASPNCSHVGCFVKGTLVHTAMGLRPIETLRIGDLVLSRRESNEGDAEYRAISRISTYDSRMVWLVSIDDPIVTTDRANPVEHLCVTSDHPFWLEGFVEEGEFDSSLGYSVLPKPCRWVTIADLYEAMLEGNLPLIRLANDRIVGIEVEPLVKAGAANRAFIDKGRLLSDGYGRCIEFNEDYFSVRPGKAVFDGPTAGDGSDAVVPFEASVYNIEVDAFRTYFVGHAGAWVHNKRSLRSYSPAA